MVLTEQETLDNDKSTARLVDAAINQLNEALRIAAQSGLLVEIEYRDRYPYLEQRHPQRIYSASTWKPL